MNEEIGNLKLICRTCLSEKDTMENVFSVVDILMICTSIQVEEGDGLPSTICMECVKELNQSHKFRLLCIESDNILRKRLMKEEYNMYDANHSVKEEFSKSKENSSESDNDNINLLFRRKKILMQKNKSKSFRKDLKKHEIKTENNQYSEENIILKSKNSDTDDDGNETSDNDVPDKELQCKYCDLKFRYKVRLKNHEQKHLEGLKCRLCNKDFSTLKQLTNHINIHSRKGAHLCQVCGKQFTLPENLVRHQRIHNGIRPYKCHLCNKSFTQSNELKSHIVTHTAEKNHLCSICGNKYSRLISLRVHMRRMHSLPPNHRPYICSVCNRNFKDRRDLSQHMQIHTGERSHICKVCNKAFNRSSNLRVHERIHTGQKPHVCSVCHRAFIQKHVLITHMRTHPPSFEMKAIDNETKHENMD